ncbi:hypothetical protein DRO64_00335 [Candidatus Bathyarchaeota archaeon]|nr:MAG: hypothetical protein DRO64_00335 [Candidatus Bathyarchaeota archaeon]
MEAVHKDFAKPIVDAIDALNAKERRQILIELEAGSLSYSEILQKTRLEKGTLNYHLKKLVASGLLRRYLREGKLYTSFYEVTTLGRRLIEGILSAFKPFPYNEIDTSTTTPTRNFESIFLALLDRLLEYESVPVESTNYIFYNITNKLADTSSSASMTAIERESVTVKVAPPKRRKR